MKNTIIILCLCLLIGCSQQSSDKSEQPTEEAYDLALAPDSWRAKRLIESKERLEKSEEGKLLWKSIQAHGGLPKWFSNGPISLHFDYQPLDGGKRRDSYQVIDQWSVRAIHEVASDRTMKYGWDGTNAWSFPEGADVGVNPRFWSTTPFYFVGLPFVLADEGIQLEMLPSKEYKGVTYDLIKVTFGEGVGDAPDDFYVLYIHPETRLMGALRYIVSYPGYFPDGGHLPEKFMEIVGHQTINGITVPTGYNTFWFKDDQPAEHITKIDVTEVSFLPELENSYFNPPSGAAIQEGL